MPARLIEYESGLQVALAAPAMQQHLLSRMRTARAYARFISPYRTGRYAERSFHLLVGVRGSPPRAFARLVNSATDPDTGYPYAVALEFGRVWTDRRTGKQRRIKRYRVLGRAADALRQ
jgi:hypothetical protein